MLQKSIKYLATVLSITVFTFLLKSCKKVDNENGISEKTKTFRQKIGSEGFQTVMNINKKSDSWEYLDKNDNVIKLKNRYQGRPDGTASLCNGKSCANADPALEGTDLNDADVYLKSATRTFSQCSGGFYVSRLDITWEASVPYSLLTQSPTNATLKSVGKIIIKNAAGSILLSNTSITPLTITYLGIDPSCPSLKMYRFSYSLSGLDNSLFAIGNTFYNGYYIYTDCGTTKFSQTPTVGFFAWPMAGPVNSPCNRTDKLWINGNTGTTPSGQGCASALGVGNGNFVAGCKSPTGWVYADVQELQYWKNSAPSVIYPSSSTPAQIGYFGIYNMTAATVGSGAWTIRYRNKMNSPLCYGPWYYEYATY